MKDTPSASDQYVNPKSSFNVHATAFEGHETKKLRIKAEEDKLASWKKAKDMGNNYLR